MNQSEIEAIARQFRVAGHTVVASPGEADLVVNTCAVTQKAVADSWKFIRRMTRAGTGAIAVTGCWVSLEPGDAAQRPNVRWVVPNLKKDRLVATVLNLPQETFDLEPVECTPLPDLRLRTRAFSKSAGRLQPVLYLLHYYRGPRPFPQPVSLKTWSRM